MNLHKTFQPSEEAFAFGFMLYQYTHQTIAPKSIQSPSRRSSFDILSPSHVHLQRPCAIDEIAYHLHGTRSGRYLGVATPTKDQGEIPVLLTNDKLKPNKKPTSPQPQSQNRVHRPWPTRRLPHGPRSRSKLN